MFNRSLPADPQKLISFLANKRVAKFKGHGIEVEFYQELPDISFPDPNRPTDEELIRSYKEMEEENA